MQDASKDEVIDFLRSAKRAMANGGLRVLGRSKNNAALAELGWTRSDREDLIYGLTELDYSKGPEPDRDKPGEIWVFGPRREGRQLYVKLKLVGADPVTRLLCISFHIAEDRLELPYRMEE